MYKCSISRCEQMFKWKVFRMNRIKIKTLLFTPCPATRCAMHRIYADRINSRDMSRVFCDLRSQKTPRGILPVNSNDSWTILSAHYVSRETLLKYSSLYNRTDAGTLAKFRYELCASCRHRALCLSVASLREWRLISARSE